MPPIYRHMKFVKTKKHQGYQKCYSFSSVSMHFPGAIYLPTFSICGNFVSTDSSRHKASEQQTTTTAEICAKICAWYWKKRKVNLTAKLSAKSMSQSNFLKLKTTQ